MFNPFKNLFGGADMDISQILASMLPKIMNDALPKLRQAFDQKTIDLENDMEDDLENDEDYKDEIALFVTKRNGKLQMDWVVINHQKIDEGDWSVEITQTLETITDEEMLANMLQATEQPPQPLELAPAQAPQLKVVSDKVKNQPIDPRVFETLPEIEARHEKFQNNAFLVVFAQGEFGVVAREVMTGNGQRIWFGSNDLNTAEYWANKKNAELKGE